MKTTANNNHAISPYTVNSLVWIFLVGLIVSLYFVSESAFRGAALLVAGISAIKFILVGFYFMETRHSHPGWKMLLLFFVGLFALMVVVMG